MKRKIIGICGLKGSGKDTFGNYITQYYETFEKVSFADILKDITSILFSWDRKLLQGDTIESRSWREQKDEFWSKELNREISPRIILQQLGTNVFRDNFHPKIWIIALKKKILESKNDIIITDARFPNEIDMIRSLGGIIIRIERGELPHWFNTASNFNLFEKDSEIPEDLRNIHPSEWKWIGYDNPDYIVKNNGTKEDLRSEAIRIITQEYGKNQESKSNNLW